MTVTRLYLGGGVISLEKGVIFLKKHQIVTILCELP
jgi:hypothetical protein